MKIFMTWAIVLLTGQLGLGGPIGAPADPQDATGLVELAPSAARADFAAGVEALHNFWLGEAADRFRAVQAVAPDFTLGYWGEALAQHGNPFGHRRPPVDTMRAILGRLAPTPEARLAKAASDHERGYLGALEILIRDGEASELHPAYGEAMGRLAAAHPGDLEAQAFHARALLLHEPTWGRATTIWPRVVEIAERILERDPDHPGALHYMIHALDTPETARRGLDAARRYARIAEGASHAVHMPSHIYMQLGMWDEVIASNRDALETSRRFVERTGRTEAALDAHAVDFLVYALLQKGRNAPARQLIEEFMEHRRRFDTPRLRWYTSRWGVVYALHTGEPPAGHGAKLPRSGYDVSSEALGVGLHALAAGDRSRAEAALAELEENAAEREDASWKLAAAEMRAALTFHDGRRARAVEILQEAIPLQSEMVRPNETSDPVKPPEELLGEMLLELEHLDEAEAAFQAGDARWPNRLATLLGLARVAERRGADAEAARRYRVVLEQLEDADPGHPAAEAARSVLEGSSTHY